MTLTTRRAWIALEAERVHLFAELAECAQTDNERLHYAHRSHVARLAMLRLELGL